MALGKSGALGPSGMALSAAATLPIVLGTWLGQRFRAGVAAVVSRKLVLGVIVLGGLSMVQPAVSVAFSAPAARPSPTMQAASR
jgi:hypothetical protein